MEEYLVELMGIFVKYFIWRKSKCILIIFSFKKFYERNYRNKIYIKGIVRGLRMEVF